MQAIWTHVIPLYFQINYITLLIFFLFFILKLY